MPGIRKQCTRCHIVKEEEKHFPYQKKRGSYATVCKACRANYLRELRKRWKSRELEGLGSPSRNTTVTAISTTTTTSATTANDGATIAATSLPNTRYAQDLTVYARNKER